MINKKIAVGIILSLIIEMPIWIYLQYWVISQLNPDRLIWFLFCIYVPTIITTSILAKIIAGEKD